MLRSTKNCKTEANELLKGYKERAEKVGVQNVVTVVEMGNPKVLLANDIPKYRRELTLSWLGLLDSMPSNV